MGQTLLEPPPFQEAAKCVACNCQFTTFKRRHHCRSCGKSLCNEHSSNHKALPQFGLYSPVRVCDECFNNHAESVPSAAAYGSQKSVEDATSSISRLHLVSDASPTSSEEVAVSSAPEAPAFDCTCGMPLCICEAPASSKAHVPVYSGQPAAKPAKAVPSSTVSPLREGTTASLSRQGSSLSAGGMPSLFFSSTQSRFSSIQLPPKVYDPSEEGMREAVKNGDVAAVKGMLAQGIDANYRDRQGMSLLHLAAVFNFTDVVFALMEAGANAHATNAQGETPLDCAQPTLAYKMREKLTTP